MSLVTLIMKQIRDLHDCLHIYLATNIIIENDLFLKESRVMLHWRLEFYKNTICNVA